MKHTKVTKGETMKKTIVIAWSEMDGMEKTGSMVMRDLNWFPEFRAVEQSRACMWLNAGTDADVEKAQKHLDTITDKVRGAVYALPTGYKNPLETARKMLMGGGK